MERVLGFRKMHILHHASEGPAATGWRIRGGCAPKCIGLRTRKSYCLTDRGREVLLFLYERVEELWNDISNEPND